MDDKVGKTQRSESVCLSEVNVMWPRRALWILIVVSAVLRLAWAASLGPGNDEAYHYLFTVHRDWSYFDHPPMLMVVETLGLKLSGGVVTPLTLRLGFIVLFAGSTWLMARLTARFSGESAGFFAALAMNLTAYFTAAASTFALPDGPLIFFWLLTLNALAWALDRPGRILPWVAVGLAWGGALLSKYHGIFLPAGLVLYLLVDRSKRYVLTRPGPYVATVVGLLCFAPVIHWNMTHDWASFAFQGGRATGGGLRFRPETLLAAILGQALYLLPWMFAALIVVIAREGAKAWREDWPGARFLLCQAIVPLAIVNLVACTRPVLPHWALVGYLAIFPILGRSWALRFELEPRLVRRRIALLATLPIVIAMGYGAQARFGLLQGVVAPALGLVAAPSDPTADQFGWDQIAVELQQRGLVNQPNTFLFTGQWFNSGQLAFALRETQASILCYHPTDARSFSFWDRPETFVGRDGILVSINGRSIEPAVYQRWFESIEPLGEFAVLRGGQPARKVRLYRCVGQKQPFPFDGRNPKLAEAILNDSGRRE